MKGVAVKRITRYGFQTPDIGEKDPTPLRRRNSDWELCPVDAQFG